MNAHPSHASAPHPYFAYIDGLRAIAVLGVIAYHLDSGWLPGGFAGVDVFFVISGFVVSASVARWNGSGLGGFLAYFYARRIRRIVPALVFCLLSTSLACTLFIPFAWLSSAIETTGRYAFFGLSNLYLASHNESYFSPTAEFNPYTHTWSLGVEEQFYLLFPLLFFAWLRLGHWRRFAVVLFVTAALASLADAWIRGRSDPPAAFYLITSRFWELGLGVLVFMAVHGTGASRVREARWYWLVPAGAWISLALIALALFMSRERTFPFPGAMLPVIGTAGALAILQWARTDAVPARLLASAPMRYVGTRSYSLYLWHWPVFVIMRWTCGLDGPGPTTVALVGTFCIAELSYRLVEQPLRQTRRLHAIPRMAVVASGIALVVAAWAASDRLIALKPKLSMSTVARHATDWYPQLVPVIPQLPGCHLVVGTESEGARHAQVFSRGGCAETPGDPRQIFVVGDSHAMAYSTLLTEHVLRSGSTVRLYPNIGCTFLSLQPEREPPACVANGREVVEDILSRARRGDILFLAALRLTRLSTQFAMVDEAQARASMLGANALQRRAQSEEAAIALLSGIAGNGLDILIDAPKPVFRTPPFRCADAFNAGNPICAAGLRESRKDMEAYRAPVMRSLERISTAVPAVHVWDPLPELCGDEWCDSMRDGKPVFFDGDHLSAHGNKILYPAFAQALPLRSDAPSATHAE
ncbi:acyltransferase family protein [Dokdonella sp.]|uniref:acyltransferase family protein n=1 Tax=Dokdonella sp. TaxID=2291710 RepID=UPI0025C55D7A|nr:acyltransferase family protein [Dokdonella sp.]MBX3693327.1 acyltransferase [Dokdonella sp.]